MTRLAPGHSLALGRAPTNGIVINDERASRLHAELVPSAAGWAIRDLGSRNGTLVGGQPITAERPLSPGDVIAIGLTEVTYCEGEPPTDPNLTLVGTGAAPLSAEMQAWQASITHRRARSRLLEDIREAAESVPRVGRAAAELCRLAFALGRADELKAMAKLALDSALLGVGAARGIVLLPPHAGDLSQAAGASAAALVPMASIPDPWPVGATPAGVAAAVIAADEALLALASPDATRSPEDSSGTISAPIRARGAVVGVLHLEVLTHSRECTPEDLEFVMAVCDALGVAIENFSAREALSTKLANTADENERLRRRLGEDAPMVVASPALQAIVQQLQRVAATKATVLIRGESGVGKELVARAIHDSSDRRGGPFVCLNCAALSETLLESELFGHEKGAFSGAVARRVGKFEAADGGTLLLDEIGEMDIRLQAKLLRALQEREIDRIGGSAPVKVDVRILATTNRDLLAEVAAGRFREDLYFRLNVISLHVPPLRERPQDIQALADHFARRFAEVNGLPNRPLSEGARHRLAGHAWRGNVRELENTLHRAVLLAHGDWIEADSIEVAPARLPAGQMPPQIAAQQVSAGQVQSTAPEPGATGVASLVGRRMEEVDRDLILETLHHTLGNRTHAATILGISIRALRNKLRDYSAAGVRVPPPPAGLAAYAAAGEAV